MLSIARRRVLTTTTTCDTSDTRVGITYALSLVVHHQIIHQQKQIDRWLGNSDYKIASDREKLSQYS